MSEKFDWKKILKGGNNNSRSGDVIYLPPNNEVRLPFADPSPESGVQLASPATFIHLSPPAEPLGKIEIVPAMPVAPAVIVANSIAVEAGMNPGAAPEEENIDPEAVAAPEPVAMTVASEAESAPEIKETVLPLVPVAAPRPPKPSRMAAPVPVSDLPPMPGDLPHLSNIVPAAQSRPQGLNPSLTNFSPPPGAHLDEALSILASEAMDTKLGLLLLDHRLISRSQLERALREQVETRAPLGTILIGMKAITEKRMIQVVAAQRGVTAWHLETDPPTPEALTLLPSEVCQHLQVLPVAVRGDLLLLAMRDPDDTAAMDTVRNLTQMRLEPVLAEERKLAHTIDTAYAIHDSRSTGKLDGLVEQALKDYVGTKGKRSDRSELTEEDTRPVVSLVNQIISDAIRMRASDIHVEPRYDRAEIRYRLDGELLKVQSIPESLIPMVTTRIKIMAEMDIVEYRVPQDGRISANIGLANVDIRVSSLPNHYGQRIVLRILDKSVGLRRLEKLGFDQQNLHMFRKLIEKPYGLLLVTGPTGSGKTTTLYAALNEIKRDGSNIMTCEDPIEYDLEGISQSQVNEKVGLTFAEQLRATLRQDPDVILVGEVRDQETAQTAIRASLTGHLVLSTLHCNDAPSSVPRLLDMGVDPYLLSTSLIGTVSQRLLRVLCPECREECQATMEDEELLMRHLNLESVPTIYRAVGCERCFKTGYKGRMAVHEVMPVVAEVSHLIADRSPVEELRNAASHYGYLPMQADALSRVVSGQTSLAEARRLLFFDSFERSDRPRRV